MNHEKLEHLLRRQREDGYANTVEDGFGNVVDPGSMTDAELDLLETRQEVGALRQELADLRALVGALERDAENARLREKHMRKELNHFHAWADEVDARSAVKASGRTRLKVGRRQGGGGYFE